MLLKILKYPDPQLKKISVPVIDITSDIKFLAENMIETMYASNGVGLAAPQVGHLLRMIVLDPNCQEEVKQPKILINPEISLIGDNIISDQEGCLSVPLNYRADIKRNNKIHLNALDVTGNLIDKEISGYEAIIIQHEIDHLDGKLFLDRISSLRRRMYEAKVKKWMNTQENV